MELSPDISVFNSLGKDGYAIVDFIDEEGLASLRDLVSSKFMSVISLKYPDFVSEFEDLSLDKYHSKSSLIDHSNTWHKAMRTFDRSLIERFAELSWAKNFKNIYGDFEILGAEEIGFPDVYMRLVRPNEPSDVGPIHADRWFTELGNHKISSDHSLLKVWVPIYSQADRDGLIGISNNEIKGKSINYTAIMKDGYIKPQIDEEIIKTLSFKRLIAPPGKAICFSYDFLHGGSINIGTNSRVSIEFTLILKDPRFRSVLNKPVISSSGILEKKSNDNQNINKKINSKILAQETIITNYIKGSRDLDSLNVKSNLSISANKLISLMRMVIGQNKNFNLLMIGSDLGLLSHVLISEYEYESHLFIIESKRSIAEQTIKNISRSKINEWVQVIQGDIVRITNHLRSAVNFNALIINVCDNEVIDHLIGLLSSNSLIVFYPQFSSSFIIDKSRHSINDFQSEVLEMRKKLKERDDLEFFDTLHPDILLGVKI